MRAVWLGVWQIVAVVIADSINCLFFDLTQILMNKLREPWALPYRLFAELALADILTERPEKLSRCPSDYHNNDE